MMLVVQMQRICWNFETTHHLSSMFGTKLYFTPCKAAATAAAAAAAATTRFLRLDLYLRYLDESLRCDFFFVWRTLTYTTLTEETEQLSERWNTS